MSMVSLRGSRRRGPPGDWSPPGNTPREARSARDSRVKAARPRAGTPRGPRGIPRRGRRRARRARSAPTRGRRPARAPRHGVRPEAAACARAAALEASADAGRPASRKPGRGSERRKLAREAASGKQTGAGAPQTVKGSTGRSGGDARGDGREKRPPESAAARVPAGVRIQRRVVDARGVDSPAQEAGHGFQGPLRRGEQAHGAACREQPERAPTRAAPPTRWGGRWQAPGRGRTSWR